MTSTRLCIGSGAIYWGMAHICDREDCPRDAVNGPKAKCFSCKKQFFLGCFGIKSPATSHSTANEQTIGNKTEKFFAPTSNVQFICSECLSPSASLNDSISTPRSERVKIKDILQEVTRLYDQIASLQSSSNEMNKKLDTIDVTTNEIKSNTETVLNKTNQQLTNTDNPMIFGSPSISTRPFRPTLHRKTPTYASMVRGKGDTQFSTPNGAKRRRHEREQVAQTKKPNVPTPKIGTGINANRLVSVPKPEPKKKIEKLKFEKAVWVSRLATTITEEDVHHHITTITPPISKFTVHRLVKKDRSVSELTFVSFKVAVNDADFDTLMDPNVWPQGVLVREFVENKPITLGAFLPADLNGNDARKSPKKSDAMETNMQSPTTESNVS